MNIAILCFGISSIANVGGTEKVFVNMANQFASQGATVYSIWNDEPGITPYYPFSPAVNQVNLGLGKIRVPISYKILRELSKGLHLNIKNYVDEYKTAKRCQKIKQQIDISKIDVMICYEFNSIMVANRLSQGKIPVVAMCHNSVEDQIESLTLLQRREVSKVTRYTVLMSSFISKAKMLLDTKICAIPNVVQQIPDSLQADLSADKEVYKVVFIGRLDRHQKQPLIAVRAFLSVAIYFPNWYFEIYGPITDQKYKKEIDDYVKMHDLQHQVRYMGITSDTNSILSKSDIFAFPSAYEGFGLTLAEANAAGIPAIGFSYAPAVNELIKSGETGFLVDNEQMFAEKMSLLMKDKELRVKMGAAAREAMRAYAPNIVWGKWERLLINLVHKEMDE